MLGLSVSCLQHGACGRFSRGPPKHLPVGLTSPPLPSVLLQRAPIANLLLAQCARSIAPLGVGGRVQTLGAIREQASPSQARVKVAPAACEHRGVARWRRQRGLWVRSDATKGKHASGKKDRDTGSERSQRSRSDPGALPGKARVEGRRARPGLGPPPKPLQRAHPRRSRTPAWRWRRTRRWVRRRRTLCSRRRKCRRSWRRR